MGFLTRPSPRDTLRAACPGRSALKVRELMTADVTTAAPGTPVHEIARAMSERGISGVPVIEDGRLLGIVTELELVVRATRLEPPAFLPVLDARIPLETPSHYQHYLQHMVGTLARDVMAAVPATVGPDEDVEALAELMVKRRVNPVPVVENGAVVGIVSRADIVKMLVREPR
jgi:CBS domain-containing protein